ncbi:Mbov_0399 family ICE element protein [Mycoplasma sp. 'Moose RK']|uniref:Mbov_0399 family ICE element protein n=1 Tax=Mycoplasma sp. 'Moose RK' TaxID=2780095 RepID=UPI0018C33AFD|nr:hypothetical protein [Mycoplasma sp. 'Moose RK']MBG0730748.1 hypothetical protein [Mycoplasma sp. 'Moose RK']MBG0731046.1 hypothetical protein [Mycoplasma sp. 'Moose RK']
MKTKNNVNKIFLILFSFSSVFLQSATYEMPIYNLEVKKETIWGDLTPKNEYSLTKTNDNFNFDLGQTNHDWKISVGLNSFYHGFTGQNDIVKNFSKEWFSKERSYLSGTCHSAGYNCGVANWSKTTIPDGVYNLNNKPNDSISDDNFEIELEDVLYGKTLQDSDQKFTDFFNLFNISLRSGDSYYKYFYHEGIDRLGQEFTKLFNTPQTGQFNLTNIKLNFEYTVKDNKITKLAVTIRAFVEYKTQIEFENKESSKLRDYFSNLRSSFNFEFPKGYEISTDSGASGGLFTEKPTKTHTDTNANNLKSNKEYFEEKINQWWNQNKKQNSDENPYNVKYSYNTWSTSKNPADFWIEFDHPLDKNRQKFYIVNYDTPDKFPTFWKPTPFLLQKEFSSRLELIPSQVWKYDSDLKGLVKQKAERKKDEEAKKEEQEKNQGNNIYGGKFEFVGDVKVKFNAAKDESEVLFINGKKVDVLDNQFETTLQDLRLEKKENGGTNQYRIEIKKFKQDKKEIEKSYSIDLVTKSVVNILQGKWFGWDPEKNLNQKKLISQYLLDDSGNPIIGENGEKLENPEYDPNIDPQTGTKKQILWVKNNGSDLADNIFYKDNAIRENGFIAEAAVAGKGINLIFSQNFQDNKATIKKFKINQNQKNQLSLAANTSQYSSDSSGKEIKINNNENDYFSDSGLWLFRVGYESDQQAFKLFLIGDNDNTKLFSDIVNSNIYIPFWYSVAGKNLEKYLKQIRGFNQKYIKDLSYEKIMAHWKSYINYKLDKGEILDPVSQEITKRIDNALGNYLQNLNSLNFDNNQKIQLKNLDFKDLEKYLNQEQKDKLKEIEFSPFKYNNNWSFEINSDLAKSLNLPNSHFEFPGLKTQNELEELKKTKTEIEIPDFESKLKDLIDKNAFDNPDNLVNKVSVLINSETKNPNIVLKIDSTKSGELKIKLLTDDKHFIKKDQYKFNLKQMQQSAQDNYDIFNVLPKNFKINLNGITDPIKASDYIKEQIEKISAGKLNFGGNYQFDPKLLNQPELFKIFQGDLKTAKSQGNLALSGISLPGYINLEIANVVPNIRNPKESNLSKIKLENIKINSKDPKIIAEELKKQLNKQLAPWGLNWEEYLTPLEFDNILTKIRHNKISEITFKPGNFLTQGDLKFKVENFDFEPYKFDLENLENSKNFLENPKNLYWFIPVSVVVLGILSFGIWFLIRKKFKKFN